MKEKLSVGIICIKYIKDEPHALLIRKRNTYAFMDFICGQYSRDDDTLIRLFNGMTVLEKIVISSLNFQNIWYFLWADNSTVDRSYYAARHRFDSLFLTDSGARLKRLIGASINSSQIWEAPKGRKRNKTESTIQCAVREFYEETGIHKKFYRIIPNVSFKYSYISEGVKYTNIYYIGLANKTLQCSISFRNKEQIREIDAMEWFNLPSIKRVDKHGHIFNVIRSAVKYVKKNPHYKNHI